MNVYLLNELVLYIPILLGIVIPMLTEAVTKSSASTAVKSAVAAAFSLLLGAVSTVSVDLLSAGAAGVPDYLLAIVVAWVVSGRAYLAGLANPVMASQPNKGFGSPSKLS